MNPPANVLPLSLPLSLSLCLSLSLILHQIGDFFGVVDSVLMRTLVNSSLFTSVSTYDYQSVCYPKRESKTAAGPRSVFVVSSVATVTLNK